jgi:hypothetical protein
VAINVGFSQIIPVRLTSRISHHQEHDQSIFSNRRNLVTVPLTKHTTNTNKGQKKPNDNSQFVPTLLYFRIQCHWPQKLMK